MKLINKKDNQITFQSEISESLANAIRRYISEVLVLAVDEVEISKNDSPLYDETVAHRIGLIPLKTDKKINEKTTGKLKINSKKEGYIYSGEFKGDVDVVYENIPITTLAKNQEIEIVADVKAGKGSEHAKFIPGLMFYRNFVDIKIDKDCPQEVIDVCPQKILSSEGGKVVVKDAYKCDVCEACVEKCVKKGKHSINLTPTKDLIITLESFGQLDIKEIFKESIDILKKDLAEVSKKIKK